MVETKEIIKMNDVVIAGIGQAAVGEHWNISLRELAFTAMEAAFEDADGMMPGSFYVGNVLAPAVQCDWKFTAAWITGSGPAAYPSRQPVAA